MILVMLGHVENRRLGAEQGIALPQIDTQHEALAALVQAREEFAFDFESWGAVGGGLLDAGQLARDLAHGREADAAGDLGGLGAASGDFLCGGFAWHDAHIVAKTQAPDEPLQAVTAGAPVAASSRTKPNEKTPTGFVTDGGFVFIIKLRAWQ